MDLNDFYKRFNLTATLEEEKSKFWNRLLNIFRGALYTADSRRTSRALMRDLAREIQFFLGSDYSYMSSPSDIMGFIEEDLNFDQTLSLAEWFIKRFRSFDSAISDKIVADINHALNLSLIDIGLAFRNGKFYPTGAKELTEKLVVDVLEWLTDFGEARESFEEAIKNYIAKDCDDAITNAYSSLESLVKELLSNDKRLDKNKNEFIEKLSLPKEFSQMIHYYCEYAHEFSSRHGRSTSKAKKKGKADPRSWQSKNWYLRPGSGLKRGE